MHILKCGCATSKETQLFIDYFGTLKNGYCSKLVILRGSSRKNYFSFVFSLWTYGYCSFLKQIWNILFSFSCKTFCWVVETSKEIEKIFAVSRTLEISQIGELGKPEKSWQILLFKRFYEIGVSYLLKKEISKWSSEQSSVSEIRNWEKMENVF